MLANKVGNRRLKEHNYYEVDHTPDLLTNKNRSRLFTLVVDNFGVKYISKQHTEHLMSVLNKHYNMGGDWDGELYCGINLSWNYGEEYVDISMPNYVHKQLTK